MIVGKILGYRYLGNIWYQEPKFQFKIPLRRSEGEELEYPFFEGNDSSFDEWGDYGVAGESTDSICVISLFYLHQLINDLMNNMRPRNRRREEEDEESEENPFGDSSSSDEQSVLRPRRNQRKDNRRWKSGMRVNIPDFDGDTLNPEGFIDWLAAVEKVFEFKEAKAGSGNTGLVPKATGSSGLKFYKCGPSIFNDEPEYGEERSCLTPKVDGDDWLKHNIFQSTCTILGKVCTFVYDSDSCDNLIAVEAVQKLGLKTKNRPKPYKLQWLKKGGEVTISKRVQVLFLFKDELEMGDDIFVLIGKEVAEDSEIPKAMIPLLEELIVVFPDELPDGFPPLRDIQHHIDLEPDRAINKITVRYRFPSPRLDDLLDQISSATIFTKLDLESGYYQIRLRHGDEWKTAFKTREGLYEWLVIPFGLSNAPSTFMRVMNQLFRPFIGKFVVVYFDDILIYSASFNEHVTHMRQILTLIRKDSFYSATKKCVLMTLKVLFLGYVVSGDGIRVDESKVAVVQEWPTLTNIMEVQSFHGLASFYRRFISNFSAIMAPLTDCINGKSFVWTKEAELAFHVVKEKLTTAPILVFPDFSKVFELHTDASKVAIGGVLSQGGRLVAFFSEKLTEPKSRHVGFEDEIMEKMNSNAYRLKLPSHIRCSNVFNVKHLLPYHGNSDEDSVGNSRTNFVSPRGNDVNPSIQERADLFLEAHDRVRKKEAATLIAFLRTSNTSTVAFPIKFFHSSIASLDF
nr:putative reverse transcriptase domain-containing protein [Tanacetum cinerariifolium]